MIYVEYREWCDIAISDFGAERWVINNIIPPKDFDRKFTVSTSNVISVIRCFIAEGKLDAKDITFIYEDEEIVSNGSGVLSKIH